MKPTRQDPMSKGVCLCGAARLALAILLPGLLAVACGAEEPPQAAPEHEPLSGSFGEVLLAYEQQLSDRAEEPGVESFRVSARFVRVRQIERPAVQALFGEGLPRSEVGPEECSPVEPIEGPFDQVLAGSLELVDAGDLALRVGELEARVPDWNFPSVYGVVAGVLYGGDAELGIGYRASQEYRIAASGSGEIGPFEVVVTAPDELTGLSVGSSEVGVEPVRLEGGADVEVRWEAGRDESEIIVELEWTQFASGQRVVCRSRDDGLAELPQQAIASLAEPGVGDARLVVYRVTRGSFQAAGLDDAEALFVISVAIPVRL